jgi:anti-sigma factor RsiW
MRSRWRRTNIRAIARSRASKRSHSGESLDVNSSITGHEGDDACVPRGIIGTAHVATNFPLMEAPVGIMNDMMSGSVVVGIDSGSTARERQHASDYAVPGFVNGTAIFLGLRMGSPFARWDRAGTTRSRPIPP